MHAPLAQDQCHALYSELAKLLPSAKIWLDVRNLDDVGKLEVSVRKSMALLVFLSNGYFNSYNCRRELTVALAENKPLILVQESDVSKGGASLHTLCAQFDEHCGDIPDSAHKRALRARLQNELKTASPIIRWVRVHNFQLVSLRMICSQLLQASPAYSHYSAPQLYVPGELLRSPRYLSSPVRLGVISSNEGAHALAKTLQKAVRVRQPSLSFELVDLTSPSATTAPRRSSFLETARRIMWAPTTRRKSSASQGRPTHVLLYLSAHTFTNDDGATARAILSELGLPIVMVHEQDTARGGCGFGEIIMNTPNEVKQVRCCACAMRMLWYVTQWWVAKMLNALMHPALLGSGKTL